MRSARARPHRAGENAPHMQSLTDAEVLHLGRAGVVVRDGAFGAALADAAHGQLSRWLDNERLSPAGTGRRGRGKRHRGDLTRWVDDDGTQPVAHIFQAFLDLMPMLSSDLRIGLQRFAVQAACYQDGAAYHRHVDAFRGEPSRRVTVIWYVNPAWSPEVGGALRVWIDGGFEDIHPVMDRMVVFLSDRVEHEVLPAQGPRFALTAWYRGPEPLPLLPDVDPMQTS